MGALQAIRGGAGDAASRWRLSLTLYIVNLVIGVVVVLPGFFLIRKALAGTTAAERLADGFDMVTYVELRGDELAAVGAILPTTLGALLFSVLFAAVAVGAVYAAASGQRGTHALLGSATRHAGAFIGLGAAALPLYLVVGGLAAVAARALWKAGDDAGASGLLLRAAAGVVVLAAYGSCAAVVAYARAARFRHPEVAWWRCLGQGIRFVCWRRPLGWMAVSSLLGLAWLLAGLAYVAAAWPIDTTGWATILVVLVLRQILVAGRVWIKVAWSSAELRLFRSAEGALEREVAKGPDRTEPEGGK